MMLKLCLIIFIMMKMTFALGMIKKLGPKLNPEQERQLRKIVLKDASITVPMEQFLKEHHNHDPKDRYFVTFLCEQGTLKTQCRIVDYKVPLKAVK